MKALDPPEAMLLESPPAPAPMTAPHLRVNFEVATPLNLVDVGWTFAAEPTMDSRWQVLATKGDFQVSAVAPRLGDAFQEAERDARNRETQRDLIA